MRTIFALALLIGSSAFAQVGTYQAPGISASTSATAKSITFSAASSETAIQLTAGARLYFGAGALQYCTGVSTTLIRCETSVQSTEFVGATFRNGSALTLNFIGYVADGASAVGFKFNTDNTISTAGSKLMQWTNNNSEKAFLNKDGWWHGYSYLNATSPGAGITFSGNDTAIRSVQNGGVIYMSDNGVNHGAFTRASTTLDNTNGLILTAKTLPTCAVGLQWAMLPDAASGTATGKRSKMCLCTSNGSSVYAWQNIATGTIGTTTTCGTE